MQVFLKQCMYFLIMRKRIQGCLIELCGRFIFIFSSATMQISSGIGTTGKIRNNKIRKKESDIISDSGCSEHSSLVAVFSGNAALSVAKPPQAYPYPNISFPHICLSEMSFWDST